MGFPSVTSNAAHKTVNTLNTASGTVLTANFGRRDGLVQNLSTDKLYVKKGTGCSDSDFTVILAPGSAADDGYGASFPLGPYTGPVSVYSAGTVRCMVSEDIA